MARRRRLLLVLAAAGLGLVADAALRPDRRPDPARGRVSATARGSGVVSSVTDAPASLGRGAPAIQARPNAAQEVAQVVTEPPRAVVGRQILFGLPGGAPADPLPGTPGAAARHLLETHRAALGLDHVPGELRVVDERTNLTGHHLRLRQYVDGVPVAGSEVAVHVGVDIHGVCRPLLLVADVFPVRGVTTTPRIDADRAVAAARALIADADDDDASFEHRTPTLSILPERIDDATSGRLVWRVDVRTDDESARVSVDATDGEIADVRDLRRAAEVTGKARVFRPNPVYSSRNAAFQDRRDASSPQLETQMFEVDLPRLDGTGLLRGRWCDAARGRGNVLNVFHDWRPLTRDHDEFELVNAYYHVDRTQSEFQRLGFTDVNADAQRVSAHHLTQDQSYFDEFADEIRFGDGGVDDAEDADVVVHEYGHAVQADMVPDFGGTSEGQAVGEGFSDFLACALHADPASPDPEWDPLVASWDATSYSSASPPFLRRTDRSKVYPRDIEDESHADGEIWSRFLWDLRDRLGPDDGLRVAVGAHAYMTANSKFKEAANAVLVANYYLRDGRDDPVIRSLLRARGLPFNQPPLDAPPEDVYDAAPWNDDAANAAPLAFGTHAALLLADDDWYRVGVAPFRRLRVQADFDAADLDLDLEIRTIGGALVSESRGVSGQEIVQATTGGNGAEFLVRATRGGGTTAIDGYSLVVQDLDLEGAVPGRTTLRRTGSGATDALTLSVGPEKVDAGKRFVVLSEARSGGARNDVRVTSPSGATVADFGEGRTPRGARVSIDATETGTWRIELRPRDGTSGRFAFRARFRQGR